MAPQVVVGERRQRRLVDPAVDVDPKARGGGERVGREEVRRTA
jgi:hypothetical protein